MSKLKKSLIGLLLIGFMALGSQLMAQSTAFGVDGSNFPFTNFVSFPVTTGAPLNIIGITATGQGGDFGPDGIFYTTAASNLMTLSLTDAALTVVGDISGVDPLHMPIIGMAYDHSSGKTYVTGHKTAPFDSELYILDLSTGVATLVGTITNSNFIITIAVNCAGQLYGIDAENGNLMRIDTQTAEGTVIGPLNTVPGFFAQDADFDPVTGNLYWSTYNGTSGELRTVDLNTGNSTLVNDWAADIYVFGIQGGCSPTGVEQGAIEVPVKFSLSQNYPNPFNPSTNINFNLESPSHVSLKIYNSRGQLVRTLVNHTLTAGEHSVSWNGKDQQQSALASGIYVYQMQAGSSSVVRKMIFLR